MIKMKDKLNFILAIIGLIACSFLIVAIPYSLIDDYMHGEERMEVRCKKDCESMDLQYKKIIIGKTSLHDQCICKDIDGSIPIW